MKISIGLLVFSFLIQTKGFAMRPVEPESPNLWTNWNQSQECLVESLFYPQSEEELIFIVNQAYLLKKKIKVLGAGHSLGPILLPEEHEWAISLKKYAKILKIDEEKRTISVQTGITFKQINEAISQQGYALENLSAISDQMVGGATQTGTHGTGANYGSLHTQIVAMTIINGQGELKFLSPDESPELFYAYQCGIGAIGIVSTVTLKMVPAQLLHEQTRVVKWPDVLDHLDEWVGQNQHFRFHWYPYANCAGICCMNPTVGASKKPAQKDPSFLKNQYQKILAEEKGIISLEDILELGQARPNLWERLNRAFFEANYCQGNEWIDENTRVLNHDFFDVFFGFSDNLNIFALETALPMDSVKAFLLDLQQLIESNHFPAHGPVEVRFVKGDRAFLSPCYSENPNELFSFVSTISILPNAQSTLYKGYFKACQELAEKYGGRQHWGKLTVFEVKDLKKAYPKWETFRQLREQEDPSGMFLNRFTKQILQK